ncbi:peptidoglycan D,D-transpeptidase FtsI family protein [Pseudactinotalea sp.]|uniref:peptidoglycan D,D-transpeptidase FtsI family protein n=1 Tax=Pseudactinotalea sp. TaxID=1926260 RepID=UPI003B3B1354
MNGPLRRLSIVVLAMFVLLMGNASWVQYGQAGALNDDPRNVRTIYREYGQDRGPIVVAGEPVAYSEPVDDPFGFQRIYADGPLYAPATGHFSVVFASTGIEDKSNAVLNGSDSSLLFQRIQQLFTGGSQQGGSVELTIDPAAQQAAWDLLGNQRGAVVALDPKTGAILALVSKPSYDPNVLAGHTGSEVNAAWTELLEDPDDPMINRTIAGDLYAPGSTFKLIDLAMLLETGDYTPDSEVPAPTIYTPPGTSTGIQNPGGAVCGNGETATLTEALRVSCNTPFAQLAVQHGAQALQEQAQAFGFNQDLSIPMTVTHSTLGSDFDSNDPALAQTSIGQRSVRVTPLQMAMVSAAIANDGSLMRPYLVATERGPNLAVVSETQPSEFSQPISASTASLMTDMMVNVVDNGTGWPGQVSGVSVAGKTGTAQSGVEGVAPTAWFTAFAPADDPQIAIAVVVEEGGDLGNEATGAQVAAPIAAGVIEAVLGE